MIVKDSEPTPGMNDGRSFIVLRHKKDGTYVGKGGRGGQPFSKAMMIVTEQSLNHYWGGDPNYEVLTVVVDAPK